MICCDNCPSSFHFACHAPPLEEEDIPFVSLQIWSQDFDEANLDLFQQGYHNIHIFLNNSLQGDWICLKCYHREQLRLATANANMTMNMVGVNSKQSKEGNESESKEESTFTATDLLEDVNALNEPSISDEGVTPGSSINGALSQPTTRSDSKKSK